MEISAFKILGIQDKTIGKLYPVRVIELVGKGFTKQNYLNAKKATGFSHEQMSSILSVSTKTIEKYKASDRLDEKASERLLKLAEIIALGIKALGSVEILNDWLKKPLRPLEGKRPIDLMGNFYGLETVKNLLGRIEHSVYS